jgi:hypothetical protein
MLSRPWAFMFSVQILHVTLIRRISVKDYTDIFHVAYNRNVLPCPHKTRPSLYVREAIRRLDSYLLI